MNAPSKRLYFIDAIRAFAIIMMLQGHFVHTLLDTSTVDQTSIWFELWEYFRGNTAPIFFTVTGFVFTFLLLKHPKTGRDNPRVKKGLKRAAKLVFWGYFLRFNILMFFKGSINPSFLLTDVLQIIGFSLFLLIGIYVLLSRYSAMIFRFSLLLLGIIIFILEPWYSVQKISFLPEFFANIFTQAEGSVFYLFPWFGYVCLGAWLAAVFHKFYKFNNFYKSITFSLLSSGLILTYFSSWVFLLLTDLTGIEIFKDVAYNNYLFIRLGNVLVIFGIFVALRKFLESKTIVDIGGRTLSIYIIHYMALYGSWIGFGLSYFWRYQLTGPQAIIGAVIFVVAICSIVLLYYKIADTKVETFKRISRQKIEENSGYLLQLFKEKIWLPVLSFRIKNR